jgi:hypothetical protein
VSQKNVFDFRCLKRLTFVSGVGKVVVFKLRLDGSHVSDPLPISCQPPIEFFAASQPKAVSLIEAASDPTRIPTTGMSPFGVASSKVEIEYRARYTERFMVHLRWASLVYGLVSGIRLVLMFNDAQRVWLWYQTTLEVLEVVSVLVVGLLSFVPTVRQSPSALWSLTFFFGMLMASTYVYLYLSRLWEDPTLLGQVAFIVWLFSCKLPWLFACPGFVVLFIGTLPLFILKELAYNSVLVAIQLVLVAAAASIQIDTECVSHRIFLLTKSFTESSARMKSETKAVQGLLKSVVPKPMLKRILASNPTKDVFLADLVPSVTVLVCQID